jgi:hypothetical protein
VVPARDLPSFTAGKEFRAQVLGDGAAATDEMAGGGQAGLG